MDSYDVLVHPIQRDNQKRTCNTMDKIKRKKKKDLQNTAQQTKNRGRIKVLRKG